MTNMLWEEEIIGGAHWSGVLRRGTVLRLTARADDANVAALFYSREQPLERYNIAEAYAELDVLPKMCYAFIC